MPRKTSKPSAEKTVRDIRQATRRRYSTEEKIRIVLEGLRGEDSIAELCRRDGLNTNVYYRWSKEFLEDGKKRLSGDTAREDEEHQPLGIEYVVGDVGALDLGYTGYSCDINGWQVTRELPVNLGRKAVYSSYTLTKHLGQERHHLSCALSIQG